MTSTLQISYCSRYKLCVYETAQSSIFFLWFLYRSHTYTLCVHVISCLSKNIFHIFFANRFSFLSRSPPFAHWIISLCTLFSSFSPSVSFLLCHNKKKLYIRIQFRTRRNFNLMQWSINWRKRAKKRMEKQIHRKLWEKSHRYIHTDCGKRDKKCDSKTATDKQAPNVTKGILQYECDGIQKRDGKQNNSSSSSEKEKNGIYST